MIADLHIHSRFSRACSKSITIPNLEKWARIKGVDLLGTGDFTHPEWIKELKGNLTGEEGVFKTKTGFPFLLSSEVSLIYTHNNKGRKVHLVLFAPNFEVVDQITEELLKIGRVDYDGRPIFGINCINFTEMMKNISKDIEIIPAHVWTPWFGLFGSMSGFDSVEEGFEDQAKHIHALETGMSSDPEMNWRLSKLDKYNLVSFSDSHSFWPWRLGREATIFDTEMKYKDIINAIQTGKGLKETIEVDPSYGKYHYDGHRNCNVWMSPEQTIKHNKICPKCGKPMTIGVDYRVNQLADREKSFRPKNAKDFKKLIPLHEMISSVYGVKQLSSKKVFDIYNNLIKEFNNEFNILLNVSEENLKKIVSEKLAKVILLNRQQKIKIRPGYDGIYGELVLEGEYKEEEYKPRQKTLNGF